MFHCRRIKSLFGTHPKYEVYMENGDTFLMASRRRKKSKTSSYLLATSKEDDITRDADSCASKVCDAGKVRSIAPSVCVLGSYCDMGIRLLVLGRASTAGCSGFRVMSLQFWYKYATC